jgi:hypothetical protein
VRIDQINHEYSPGRAHPCTEDLKLATGSGAHQRNDLISPDSSDHLAGGSMGSSMLESGAR